jgi:hypothetical protein
VRAHLAKLDDAGRRSAWQAVLDADILTPLRQGRTNTAREVATACLLSVSD